MLLLKVFLKRLFIFFLLILITSCAGTGTKTIPNINVDNKNIASLFFYRTGGYIAGGVLAGIEVNGEEIARLGTNEYTQYTVNGNYSVHVFGAGINGFGMGSGRVTGQGKKGAKHFYLIDVDAGLFTTSFTINEVTETTFKQLR